MFNAMSKNYLEAAYRRAKPGGTLLFLLGWGATFSISGVSFGQEKALERAASVIQPQAYVSLQPVPRGRSFDVAVVAKIAPGFHVNAHEPSESYLIPTKVTAELPPGVVVVETAYPRGVMRKFQFATMPLRVYEASFTVKMRLRAASAAALGPQKIALNVGYQACTQDTCLPPANVPAVATIQVAAADTPAYPANPAIFSSGPAPKFPAPR
jgi:DsbC/DsbD-like thiol-disulfide interchange protein